MKNNFKENFEYLMSLSNKELRKEIENSNWNFILQELRYAGDEIERLNNIIDKAIEYIEKTKCNDLNEGKVSKNTVYINELLHILKGK